MRLRLLFCLPFFACRVAAAAPAVTDNAFLQAAVVLGAFDRLAAACAAQGGFAPAQQSVIDDWRAAQKIDLIRARLPELAAHPVQQGQVDTAATSIVGQLAQQQLEPCPAATSMTRLPQAQFTDFAQAWLVTSDAPVTTPPAPAVPSTPPAKPSAALAAIDSIGFHTRPKMGIGGFIALDIYPVLLLRSGDLVHDVAALREPGGLDAHRTAHPEDWTKWRRTGGKIELLTDQGWSPLGFDKTYSTLPPGLVLNGRYRSLEGVGNLAVGGTDSVVAWNAYRFTPDGRVEREGGAGSSAAFGNTSVATSANAGVRTGRYRIDGLTLAIDYDDGSQERRILVVDPADTSGALWLDGESYVERN